MARDFVLSPVEGLTRAEVTSLIDPPFAPLSLETVGEGREKGGLMPKK